MKPGYRASVVGKREDVEKGNREGADPCQAEKVHRKQLVALSFAGSSLCRAVSLTRSGPILMQRSSHLAEVG